MRIFQIDRLNCKRELVMMIIKGSTLSEMVEFITKRDEQCSNRLLTVISSANLLRAEFMRTALSR
jgi:hypothetical protein